MPYLQIMQNAGVGSYEMNRNTIYELDKHEGFNALTLQDKVNLIEAGIIDPVKVTKSSLRTAISIALLVLTTEVAVIRKDEDDTGNQGLY